MDKIHSCNTSGQLCTVSPVSPWTTGTELTNGGGGTSGHTATIRAVSRDDLNSLSQKTWALTNARPLDQVRTQTSPRREVDRSESKRCTGLLNTAAFLWHVTRARQQLLILFHYYKYSFLTSLDSTWEDLNTPPDETLIFTTSSLWPQTLHHSTHSVWCVKTSSCSCFTVFTCCSLNCFGTESWKCLSIIQLEETLSPERVMNMIYET